MGGGRDLPFAYPKSKDEREPRINVAENGSSSDKGTAFQSWRKQDKATKVTNEIEFPRMSNMRKQRYCNQGRKRWR